MKNLIRQMTEARREYGGKRERPDWDTWNRMRRVLNKSPLLKGEEDELKDDEIDELNKSISAAEAELSKVVKLFDVARARFEASLGR